MAGQSGPHPDSGGKTYARDNQGKTQYDSDGGHYFEKSGRVYKEKDGWFGKSTKDVGSSGGSGK